MQPPTSVYTYEFYLSSFTVDEMWFLLWQYPPSLLPHPIFLPFALLRPYLLCTNQGHCSSKSFFSCFMIFRFLSNHSNEQTHKLFPVLKTDNNSKTPKISLFHVLLFLRVPRKGCSNTYCISFVPICLWAHLMTLKQLSWSTPDFYVAKWVFCEVFPDQLI